MLNLLFILIQLLQGTGLHDISIVHHGGIQLIFLLRIGSQCFLVLRRGLLVTPRGTIDVGHSHVGQCQSSFVPVLTGMLHHGFRFTRGHLHFILMYQGENLDALYKIIDTPLAFLFQPFKMVVHFGHILVVHEVIIIDHHQVSSTDSRQMDAVFLVVISDNLFNAVNAMLKVLLTIRRGGAYDRQEYDGEYSVGSHSQQMSPLVSWRVVSFI